jgi:2-dehydro-3-deoxyphosphooctonate aldolase (KDO 8-P synthase)
VKTREVRVGDLRLGGGNGLFLVAGPCVIESLELCLETARGLKQAAAEAGMPFIFKASFDKANRSALTSFRGPGLEKGLEILQAVKRDVGVPVLTDIHEPSQAEPAAEVVDVLQVPALLCRQTDLLVAAGETGKPVNVKKGQFMAPGDMRNVVEKVRSTDNDDILLTERGTCFGYHYLVNDMRSLPSMRLLGCPVIFDATHSVQLPGGQGTRSGGEREFIPVLARAAVAAGVDGIFVEAHPAPDRALSDGPNMLPLTAVAALLRVLKQIEEQVRQTVEAEEFDLRPIRPGSRQTLVSMPPREPED